VRAHEEIKDELGEFDPRRASTVEERIADLEQDVRAVYEAFRIVGALIDELREEIAILDRRL
jgi:hypothetical protein